MQQQMILTLVSTLLFLSACTWYGEYEHISSIPNGTPFNEREETSADILWTGIRAKKEGWYIDAAVGAETSNNLEGRLPYGRFIVGKEIKTWGDDSD